MVNTRAPEQAQELTSALEALGAEVRQLPMVSFAPPEDSTELDAALRRFDGIRLDDLHQPKRRAICFSAWL